MLPQRKAFDQSRPWLQWCWDSSSLSNYLRCPRRYYYNTIMGYRPNGESVDLKFGTLVHKGLECYNKAICSGRSHDEAQIDAILECLEKAGDWSVYNAGTPTEPEPDYAFNGYWKTSHSQKNLWNVLKALVWKTEEFTQGESTLMLGDVPGVELPFQFDLEAEVDGIQLTYAGHLDRVVQGPSGVWVVDYKTTTKTLGSNYFDGYTPSTQLPGYLVAGQIVLGTPPVGVRIDACQVGVDFVRWQSGHILLNQDLADEWLVNITGYIAGAVTDMMEAIPQEAEPIESDYPMNTESCFLCQFKSVCRQPPRLRKHLLEADFKIEYWDALDRDKKGKL